MARTDPLIPLSVRTARLLLRPWQPADAAALAPVLEANVKHLGPWIPAHVATPLAEDALGERLAGFAAAFAADQAYRYAVLVAETARVIGEVDLFPRAAGRGRVTLAEADHVELGYWLDAAVTGQGFATEATSALFDVAGTLPGMTHVEIRCDQANTPSAAIPKRLGFYLSAIENESLQVWRKSLSKSEAHEPSA